MRSDLDTFGEKQWQKEIKKKLYKKLREFLITGSGPQLSLMMASVFATIP